MLCSWEHTLLKIRRIQKILGRLFRSVLLFVSFHTVMQVSLTVYNFFHLIFLQRIMAVQYKIPDYVHISQDCRHLLSRIFVASSNRVRLLEAEKCLMNCLDLLRTILIYSSRTTNIVITVLFSCTMCIYLFSSQSFLCLLWLILVT